MIYHCTLFRQLINLDLIWFDLIWFFIAVAGFVSFSDWKDLCASINWFQTYIPSCLCYLPVDELSHKDMPECFIWQKECCCCFIILLPHRDLVYSGCCIHTVIYKYVTQATTSHNFPCNARYYYCYYLLFITLCVERS